MENKNMNLATHTQPVLSDEVLTEVRGQVGFITLNRPKALNALSLDMIRALSTCLHSWGQDPAVKTVALRGTSKTGPFGALCAGGDIRFFHQAALAGDHQLEDFFTEEYALNHLIHRFPKPFITFMDGIVMGGGMGLCGHGAENDPAGLSRKIRLVTERTKMAMPETQIGLFPDVGGGYFLSRCPGHVGEWLALTGELLGAADALAFGLGDAVVGVDQLQDAWDGLAQLDLNNAQTLDHWLATYSEAAQASSVRPRGQIDQFFSLPSVLAIIQALEVDETPWAQHTAATLRKRSPLMLHVALEQVRQARTLTLAKDLRMERDMVHHCFNPVHLGRSVQASETVEGIRALAVDKDHTPHWSPIRIEDVIPEMVAPFFSSPWTPETHPLRGLI
jgi:enoyl-CoA hydratase/carnithine racemase